MTSAGRVPSTRRRSRIASMRGSERANLTRADSLNQPGSSMSAWLKEFCLAALKGSSLWSSMTRMEQHLSPWCLLRVVRSRGGRGRKQDVSVGSLDGEGRWHRTGILVAIEHDGILRRPCMHTCSLGRACCLAPAAGAWASGGAADAWRGGRPSGGDEGRMPVGSDDGT